jgi:protein involved in polysaccharide export with SLBB domain
MRSPQMTTRRWMMAVALFAVLLTGVPGLVSWIDARRRVNVCYVVGDVITPGRLETWGRRWTIRSAITATGGLRPSANRRSIRLVRPATATSGETILPVNLGDPTTDYTLKPGDRLIVHRGAGK